MFRLLLIAFTFFACCAMAQAPEPMVLPEKAHPKPNQPYTMVEEMPEFPGGQAALTKYLQNTIVYPKLAIDSAYEGRVYVKFVIDTGGKVTDVTVVRSSKYKCLDIEALRVVKMMPKWKPGKSNGKKVPVYYNLPVTFRLPEPAEATDPNAIHTEVEQPAYYPTGAAGLEADIDQALKLSPEMKPFMGKCFVTLTVEKNGSVSETRMLRGIADCKECDQAVLAALKKLKPFTPAMQKGAVVRSYYNVIYNFDGSMIRLNNQKK